MTPLVERDVLAHQEQVAWGQSRQVEQDLQLCRMMVAIFGDKFLRSQVAMRGGTLLHKVHLPLAARYSEDIDLVVFGERPADHIRRALVRVLLPILGKPSESIWDWVKLTIRNPGKPSRILRLGYTVPSVSQPGENLQIKVEANVDEKVPHRPIVELPFSFPYRGGTVQTILKGYDLHEMLGTKLRALFQRRAGRDLFDLYWALTQHPKVIPAEVIASFAFYLRREGIVPRRQDCVERLRLRLAHRGFCTDMISLLRPGIAYDPQSAGHYLEVNLLSLLPE